MWIEGHWQQVRICCSRFGCSGSFFVAVNPKAVAVLRRDKHNCWKNSSAVAEMPARQDVDKNATECYAFSRGSVPVRWIAVDGIAG